MGFTLNILVLWSQAETPGHFLRSFPNRQTTHLASPLSHNLTGLWYLWIWQCQLPSLVKRESHRKGYKGHFLCWVLPRSGTQPQPANHQPRMLTNVSIFLFYQPVKHCPHDKRIGNSLPTSKAIGIDSKEDVSGMVCKLPVERRKRSNAFIFNCQRQCTLYPFQWSCTLNAFNIHECKYKHVKEKTLVENTYMNLMGCQHCSKHFLYVNSFNLPNNLLGRHDSHFTDEKTT